MNIQDRKKTLTVEELRRRYNLDSLDKDRKAIQTAKEKLNKVDSELNDFVKITTENLKELQDQVDGNITTWFFNGVPTLNNEPANSWTTDEDKINHLGDLYYDQDTGYAYRWAYDNNEYKWSKIVDADVVKALAVANAAQDTADSKRRTFVDIPIPPYDIGDIWIKDDQDLYRCRASRENGTMNIADWILATKYTDDTVALETKAELDQFKVDVQEGYVSNATLETTVNSITGRVEETYTYVTTIEHQINDITTTTQTSTGGNSLYLEDALESNALEYHVDGKSEQDGTPTPDAPVEIKSIPSIRNLFDKDNANILNANMISNGVISSADTLRILYIKCDSNKSYTVEKIKSSRFAVGYTYEVPTIGSTVYNIIQNNDATKLTISTNSQAQYLLVFYYHTTNDTLTEQEILDSIMIEEGQIAHDFVPYGAWAKVKVTGKNLFNKTSGIIENYYFASNGDITYTSTANNFLQKTYIEVKPSKDYILFGDSNSKYLRICEYDKNKNFIKYNTSDTSNELQITTSSSTKYLRISFTGLNALDVIQLEEGINPSEHEEYKEKEVLIDLNKPNLFTGENITSGKRLLYTGEYYTDPDYFVSDYIPINTNTLYKVNYEVNAYTRMCFYDEDKSFLEYNQTTNIINTSKAVYVRIGGLLSEIDNIVLHEGYLPYYEISSINDIENTLDIVDGQTSLTQKIEKIILDGSENYHTSGAAVDVGVKAYRTNFSIPNFGTNESSNLISTHFRAGTNWSSDKSAGQIYQSAGNLYFRINETLAPDLATFKDWLLENNVTVYYELAEPQQIILPNVQIPLFDGVNHITLVDNLETNTSIKYYRKTAISNDYVIQQQLDETNSNLSNTDNKVSQAQSDINATNINLNNNYYNKDQIDIMNTSTEQIITQIKNTVETTTSATNLQISVLQEQLKNGVTSVKTETGYTFDIDGLKIQKEGEPMKAVLDNEGLIVYRDSIVKLKVSGNEVYTDNLTVNTYLIQKPIRREKGKSISDGDSIGIVEYWVGVDN